MASDKRVSLFDLQMCKQDTQSNAAKAVKVNLSWVSMNRDSIVIAAAQLWLAHSHQGYLAYIPKGPLPEALNINLDLP